MVNTSCICFSILLIPFLAYLSLKLVYSPPNGLINVPSIHGEATITYDKSYGISYISGSTNEAVAYALGFAHASDRLYDLQLKRALASGRVSEMFGKDAIFLDKYFRALQFTHVVEKDLEQVSQAHKKLLEAYANGVNAYVEHTIALPMEFQLLGIEFEKWTIKDSALVFKLLSFMMSTNWQLIPLRTEIAQRFGKEMADKLIPFKDYDSFLEPVSIVKSEPIKLEPEKKEEEIKKPTPVKPPVPPTPKEEPTPKKELEPLKEVKQVASPKGSNAWAVHGNYTASGKPLIANDPHLAHHVPSEMYLVSLKYPHGPTLTGASLPGTPLVILGRNEKLAWGITMSLIENVDLYELRLDESHQNYYYNNTWNPLKLTKEIIKVKDSEDVMYMGYKTHHGPILDYPLIPEIGSLFAIGTTAFMDRPLAISWAGFREGDRSIEAAFRLDWAESAADLANTVKLTDSLVTSLSEGDIGYWATGKVPIRRSILDSIYTRNGTLVEDDWTGYYPIEENPHVINPKEGFVVSCNNKLNSGGGFHSMGTTFPTTTRAVRATKMLKEKIAKGEKIDSNYFKKMQMDVHDEFAKELKPLLLTIVERFKHKFFGKGSSELNIINSLTKALANWDEVVAGDSKAALIFNLWTAELSNRLLHQYFNNTYERRSVVKSFFSNHLLGQLVRKWAKLEDLDSGFCKNRENTQTDVPCAYNVVISLLKTYESIVYNLGENEENWKWAYMNVLQYGHLPLSQTILKPLFHLQGNPNTLFMTAIIHSGKDATTACGPVYRMVADMNSMEETYLISDVGQSGNVLSEHYDDFVDALLNGKYAKYKEKPKGRVVKLIG